MDVDEYDRNHLHNVDGMLLYAKTKENVFDDAQITHRDGYTLYIRTLDLNTNFEVIKECYNPIHTSERFAYLRIYFERTDKTNTYV